MEQSKPVPTYAQTRAAMILRGTTLTVWAREHGYQPRYVINVLLRWGGRDAAPAGRQLQKPRGIKAKRVLRDLAKTLATDQRIAKKAA
jgi:hypothetical protein